ncbi:MAG: hypothetical protein U5J63_00595 [Fodinibius sp.]|nr:hypothetical protein [Fodinibius sp.]
MFGSNGSDIADWDMKDEIDDILSETKDRVKPRQRRRTTPLMEVSPEQLHQRSRPVRGGFSVGHYKVTAGTMATACYARA